MAFVPGLILIAVVVDRVAIHLQFAFLPELQGPMPYVGYLLGVVSDNAHPRGLAQPHEPLNLLDDVGISESIQFINIIRIEKTL
ncbi:hypothetical protein ES703_118658 [subsurface metagenome]